MTPEWQLNRDHILRRMPALADNPLRAALDARAHVTDEITRWAGITCTAASTGATPTTTNCPIPQVERN
jgi:hypothetical protein